MGTARSSFTGFARSWSFSLKRIDSSTAFALSVCTQRSAFVWVSTILLHPLSSFSSVVVDGTDRVMCPLVTSCVLWHELPRDTSLELCSPTKALIAALPSVVLLHRHKNCFCSREALRAIVLGI